ncbi:MAG: amino acid ABC transporter ATP-binding protein [Proteocatella sp.]
MLEVINLNKKFANLEVLKDVSLKAYEGEILCIRGESGAGKTTLIRCICNLESYDRGEIIIDSQNKDNFSQEKVGLVFQNFNLFPHMNIIDNLTVAPVTQKLMSKEDAEKKALELLTKLGIESKAKNYPFELSGGQKQRVAIARACMLNPKVLCFDEPTSALDSKTTQGIVTILKTLAKEGMCIVIISHDNEFCDMVSDRQLMMEKGKLIEM